MACVQHRQLELPPASRVNTVAATWIAQNTLHPWDLIFVVAQMEQVLEAGMQRVQP